MELGETNDPKQLVPGNPVSVTTTLTAMRQYGDALHAAGAGLSRIDTTDGWSGPAGDAFRTKFQGQPNKWLVAGDCFHNAANALETYNATLEWAQGRAGDAIQQWNTAQAATTQARAQHDQNQRLAGHDLPFNDPGAAGRQAAQATLDTARTTLRSAGDAATTAVGRARDQAPQKPGFWDDVGSFFSDVGADLENFAGTVVNSFASFGNALINHPGDVVTSMAGAGLMAVGAGGEIGGAALDATGIGAIIGVPANAVSAGAIATGGTMAAAGMGDLMMHASSDDRVNPMRTDHTGTGDGEYEPTDGFRGSEYSQDEIEQFVQGHTGDGNPVMNRPSPAQVNAALNKATPVRLEGQNAESFDYNGIRVIVNYDVPWKSTAYKIGQ